MSNPHTIPPTLVREHVERLAAEMAAADLAAVVVFHPSNMLAFTGTSHSSSDRVTCGIVSRDAAVAVVCPAFERPNVAAAEEVATIHTWQEHESPYACCTTALRALGSQAGTIGLDGRTWLAYAHQFEAAFAPRPVRSAEPELRRVRICKSPAEQTALREAARCNMDVFAHLRDHVLRPGLREVEVVQAVKDHYAPDGLHVEPLVQSGPNGAIPHNPTGQRVLQAGDTIVIDSVIVWGGYISDITRTFALGEPSHRAREAYELVRRAQAAAIEAAQPGVPCARLDAIARGIIASGGFAEYFTHRLGHGMGLEGHEPPYLCASDPEVLREGMCCTVEPGVYVPGEFGIRLEDDILITEAGCEVLTADLPTDISPGFCQ